VSKIAYLRVKAADEGDELLQLRPDVQIAVVAVEENAEDGLGRASVLDHLLAEDNVVGARVFDQLAVNVRVADPFE
jgi:hypothetical protein